MLKVEGTVEEYEAKADSVKASLRQELLCFLPACVLTVTVKAGSVILTVVATDTTGGASQVESAAVALQAKPLKEMSRDLGVIIEEAPAAPSVIDVQVQITRLAPSPPLPRLAPSPPLPSPLPPGAGIAASSDSVTAQDAGPGLAIGLALGGCLLVVVLAAVACFWHRKRRTQPPSLSASTRALQQIEVTVTQPEEKKAAAPQSLASLLAACGLEHHEKTFLHEGYTLDNLLSSVEQGEETAKSDLRELKLTLGECRQLITHVLASK